MRTHAAAQGETNRRAAPVTSAGRLRPCCVEWGMSPDFGGRYYTVPREKFKSASGFSARGGFAPPSPGRFEGLTQAVGSPPDATHPDPPGAESRAANPPFKPLVWRIMVGDPGIPFPHFLQ